LSRDLKRAGHAVVGVDVSTEMIAAARAEDPGIETHVADAASLPFQDAAFDCVIAFMSLQDIDDLPSAVREVERVLEPQGRFCIAVVHPLASAGSLDGEHETSPLTIKGSYLESSYYRDVVSRDGLEMTFVSAHRSIETYIEALAHAGMVIERLREPGAPESAISAPRGRLWQRVPLFLHVRALKPE